MSGIKRFLSSLLDKKGWRRDLNKIFLILIIAAVAGLVWLIITRLDLKRGNFIDFWEYRLYLWPEKVSYEISNYERENLKFSFVYPDYFILDSDEKKKFGSFYLSGFHLESDTRIGCDVRISPVGINFQKSDPEIGAALEKDLSKNVKEFQLSDARRTKVGAEDGFQMVFTFADPINQKVRLKQLMTTHNGINFLLVCGAGDYPYDFFRQDFDNFFSTFKWD